MTKKDYELIAEVFHIYQRAFKSNEEQVPNYRVTGSALVREMTFKMADTLKEKNPRFNKHLFHLASGQEV